MSTERIFPRSVYPKNEITINENSTRLQFQIDQNFPHTTKHEQDIYLNLENWIPRSELTTAWQINNLNPEENVYLKLAETKQAIALNNNGTIITNKDDAAALIIQDTSPDAQNKPPILVVNGLNSSLPDTSLLAKSMTKNNIGSKITFTDMIGNGLQGLTEDQNGRITAPSIPSYSEEEYIAQVKDSLGKQIDLALGDKKELTLVSQSAAGIPSLEMAMQKILSAKAKGEPIPKINLILSDPFLGVPSWQETILRASENDSLLSESLPFVEVPLKVSLPLNIARRDEVMASLKKLLPPEELKLLDMEDPEAVNAFLKEAYEKSDENKLNREYPRPKAYTNALGLGSQIDGIGSKAVTGKMVLQVGQEFNNLMATMQSLSPEQKKCLQDNLTVTVLKADSKSQTEQGKLNSLEKAFAPIPGIFSSMIVPSGHNMYLTNPQVIIDTIREQENRKQSVINMNEF